MSLRVESTSWVYETLTNLRKLLSLIILARPANSVLFEHNLVALVLVLPKPYSAEVAKSNLAKLVDSNSIELAETN